MKTREDVADLLGTLSNEEIAALAEVSVEQVQAWRDEGDAPAAPAPKGAAKKPATRAAKPAVPPKVQRGPAPDVVQGLRNQRVSGPTGRTLRVDFRGIYRGELATFLWEHYPDLVKAKE